MIPALFFASVMIADIVPRCFAKLSSNCNCFNAKTQSLRGLRKLDTYGSISVGSDYNGNGNCNCVNAKTQSLRGLRKLDTDGSIGERSITAKCFDKTASRMRSHVPARWFYQRSCRCPNTERSASR